MKDKIKDLFGVEQELLSEVLIKMLVLWDICRVLYQKKF